MKGPLIAILAAVLILWLTFWILSHSFLILPVLPIFTFLGIVFVALLIYVRIKKI